VEEAGSEAGHHPAGKPTNGKAQLPNGKTMTREDIIRMAREAELNAHGLVIDRLERFANLVAEHEREECAKMCEDSDTWDLYDPNGFAANLIRARGEK
jgi:hypothetical protein